MRAHEDFLASDALRGRGSGTRDEWIAATYVASRFESYGLKPMGDDHGYMQRFELVAPQLDGHAQIASGNLALHEGPDFYLVYAVGENASGPLQKLTFAQADTTKVQPGAIVLLTGPPTKGSGIYTAYALADAGAAAVLMADNPAMRENFTERFGGKTKVQITLKGEENGSDDHPFALAVLAPTAMQNAQDLADGAPVDLAVHRLPAPPRYSYNAMAMLPGTDAASGTILISAHLDHLGIGTPFNGDAIYNGADDDASGTTAVLEIAHALAAGARPKRNVLFVCFGSEELGDLGSDYFRAHSPVPLTQIIANLEFEMIGAQDPKMPPDTLLLTGWDRSNLGPELRKHGAKLGPDPYKNQHFFRRSDNYALALKGVVAHTAAGWAMVPYYHRPDDDLKHLDVKFMTTVIQSLIGPLRWLASSDFRPAWNPGGQPHP